MSKEVHKHADKTLAEMTGKSRDDFSAEGYRIPDPDELERVPVEELED